MDKNKTVLLLLTRSPEVGKVKTRLIPDIGKEGATKAHIELLTKVFNTIKQCEFLDIQLWLKGDLEVFKSYFQIPFLLHEQVSNDLGENMFEAAKQALQKYQQVIIIGSDCPDLSVNDLQETVKYLSGDKDLVLGPAEDGGYYLIGFSQLYSELFSGIEWGTESVMRRTLQKTNDLSLNVSILRKHYDVDTAEDYVRFKC